MTHLIETITDQKSKVYPIKQERLTKMKSLVFLYNCILNIVPFIYCWQHFFFIYCAATDQ